MERAITIAITRPISASLRNCELTHQSRTPIDLDRARRQHADMERTLESLGVIVRRVPAADELPDAVFVEDTAIVVDEAAVVTRPGAASRRPEIHGVAAVLSEYRPLVRMTAPATLDGGDVLRIGKTFYVGLSSRTNATGAAQLRDALEPFGYRVATTAVSGCLHLKSAVTAVADHLLLVNPLWIARDAIGAIERIEVDPSEPLAANALRIGDAVIYPAHYPRTRRKLEECGLRVIPIECDELAKAEGAVTCCSLILGERAGAAHRT
jgi:dimethylargininase